MVTELYGSFSYLFFCCCSRPSVDDVHADYVEASQAGKHGVDCLSLYHQCPIGSGLLDGISYFKG